MRIPKIEKKSMRDIGHATLRYITRMVVILACFFLTSRHRAISIPTKGKILFPNAVLGWTVVGWVIALRWALKPLGPKE